MVGPTEVALSRDLLLRARKRLGYQHALVSKLDPDCGSHHDHGPRDIYLVMQVKVDRMIKQHDELVGGTGDVLSCHKTS